MGHANNDELGEFSRLIAALYRSLTDDQPWFDFLVELRDHLGAQYAVLIVSRAEGVAPSLMLSPRGNPQGIADYCEHLFRIDPFANIPEGTVVCHDYQGDVAFRQTAFFREYLQYEDTTCILAFNLATAGFFTRVRITRTMGNPPFGPAEHARCERLIPHIRQAMELYQRLEITRKEQAVYSSTIAQLAIGSVSLDEGNNILQANSIADAILSEADGIKRVGARIVLDTSKADADFRAFLHSIKDDTNDRREVFRVERSSGKRDIAIFARTVEAPDYLRAARAPVLVLYLNDPERHGSVTADSLRTLFDLTPMEAAISALIANGMSVVETGEQLGITENTVRAHLRSIFAKTGISRQSQLVHLVHTSFVPAPVP